MRNPIKIGIVGAGNVGRTLAVILSANGYYVEAVTGKNPHNIQIDNYTAYEITGDFGNKQYLVRVIADIVDLSQDLDIIFVCTKIFDAVSMLTSSDQRNGYIKMALSNSTFFADSLQFVHLIEL